MDYTLEAEFYATAPGARGGHVTDIPRHTSTLCCGMNWGDLFEAEAHRIAVHF